MSKEMMKPETLALAPDFRFNLIPAIKPEQLHENMRSAIARDLPFLSICDRHDLELSIVGGGPSLEDTYKDLIGYTAAVNQSLSFLLDHDVVPNAVGVCDPGPHMVDLIEARKSVTYFLATTVHPSVFDKLINAGCYVVRWNCNGIPEGQKVLEEIEPGGVTIGGGSTMGLRWITLGYACGFRKFHLHGLDSSFRIDPVRGRASHAYPDHQDDKDWVMLDGFQTRPNFIGQVIDFLAWLDRLREPSVEPVSLKVYGEGLLQSKFAEWKKFNPGALESSDIGLRPQISSESEKSKYRRMWAIPEYRFISPGELLVRYAVKEMGMFPPESVIDFGCGPGRATRRFKNRGFEVVGVDIAPNCLDPEIDIDFREVCLWDELPKDLTADWGYCCDVMEHIPTDKVDAVLANIAKATRKGAFFQIATGAERFGDRIGETLHLTVAPADWWEMTLKKHFAIVETTVPDRDMEKFRVCFKVGNPPKDIGW